MMLFKAVGALHVLLIGVAMGAPLNSCGEQADCLNWSIEELTGADATNGCDGNCEFKVCVDVSFSGSCVKDPTDTFSHICEWPADQCPATATSKEVDDVGTGSSYCQIGAAGQTLTFVFKDGNSCFVSATEPGYAVAGLDTVQAICGTTTSAGQYCTGNGAGVQCVWTVALPDCSFTPPRHPPPEASPPSPPTRLPPIHPQTPPPHPPPNAYPPYSPTRLPPIAPQTPPPHPSPEASPPSPPTSLPPNSPQTPPSHPSPESQCPRGKNVCYTPDCACVLGSCNPAAYGDSFLLLDSHGNPLPDGKYSIPATCESGKDLSNAITIGAGNVCVKDEPGTALEYVIAHGELITPLSMKCGRDCFLYGGFAVACN